ncbi:phage regulatory protein/antirepressor Ant [Paraburkholderia nemoris]|uniref:phage antirepressor KilAC domain-containing protein n=1 Tax=Paraburkholderia nemoris TaxID=2793076 RepID=UPI0038B77314
MATLNQGERNSCKSAAPATTGIDCNEHVDGVSRGLVHLRGAEPVTDSLTIAHEFGRPHKNVLASIDGLIVDGTINRLDFKPVEYVDAKGERRRAFELTERAALIAMPFIGGRKSREGQVRLVDAFIRFRSQAAEARPHGQDLVPQTLPDALRLAADLAEQRTQLQQTVQRQAVHVAALDLLSAADGSVCVTDAAKTLKVPPRSLIAWLDRNAWTYRRSGGPQIAYQAAIMRGLLEHASRTIRLEDGTDKAVSSVRVTPKGLAELARKVANGAIRSQGGAR